MNKLNGVPDANTSPQGRGFFQMNKKVTQKDFETFLNQNSPEQGSDHWIIGGTIRMADMWRNTYGSALRKHNPIAFNTGFKEYERKFNTRM